MRDGYDIAAPGYAWLTDVYKRGRSERWSSYATELYLQLSGMAHRDRWLSKLRYLLYEDKIVQSDAERFRDLAGVWLQSKPGADGKSQNPWIAELQ